ncbi:down syndrome cell adhesion molecule-like protein Dscam2 [Caerostris extrusa]|uniref:Down syndrome cell adhesion molecule-like protein Dscam2 n=1 Tax=Caerostris extrusa TaxID=172846 RepID=A0AAV4SGT4_CAEEX|nr:down syndrome cell adhesion molecule-like protein Dscam2 [Caerostris extrusa]
MLNKDTLLFQPPETPLQFGKIKGYYVATRSKTPRRNTSTKHWKIKKNFREERVLTNLERNTKYVVRVQAFNSKGAGPPSDDVEGGTLEEDPPRPPSLEVLGMTSSSVTLKWKKDTAETGSVNGYIIFYKKEYGYWKSEEVFGDINTYTLSNLQCGMRYDIYITTIDGNDEKSEIITGRTSGRAPIAPEKEDLLSVNDTSVTIQLNSWKSGGCPITHFEIKYKQQRQKNWILYADRVSSNRKSLTINSLLPSTWYQLQLTSHNEAGPTEAEYIFTTGASVKGALPDAVLVSDEAVPFYLSLKSCFRCPSLVVVVAVLVLVCLIVRKRNPTETSQTGANLSFFNYVCAASATYVSRKSQAGESVHMCEMEKSTYQRPVSRADPIYYPTPYATTHIADGPCRKSLRPLRESFKKNPSMLQSKNTKATKSDVHIYHYPVHIPPELLDELQKLLLLSGMMTVDPLNGHRRIYRSKRFQNYNLVYREIEEENPNAFEDAN